MSEHIQQSQDSLPKIKKRPHFKFSETFSLLQLQKNEVDVDIDDKIDAYESKVEKIFKNNFDVFNGFMTIKTPFKKIPRPQPKIIKSPDLVQSNKVIEDTIKLLKKTLNNDQSMKNEFFNRKKNLLKLKKVKKEEGDSITKIGRGTFTDDFYSKESSSSVSKSRNFYKKRLSSLPSLTLSPTNAYKSRNSQSNFTTLPSTICLNTYQTEASPLEHTESFRTINLLSHKNILNNLMTNFKKEENLCKSVSNGIKKIKKFDVKKLHMKVVDENDIYRYKNLKDMTKSRNLFTKKKEVLFYKKDPIVNDTVSGTSLRKHTSLDNGQILADQRKKVDSLLMSNTILKGSIDNLIKKIKKSSF